MSYGIHVKYCIHGVSWSYYCAQCHPPLPLFTSPDMDVPEEEEDTEDLEERVSHLEALALEQEETQRQRAPAQPERIRMPGGLQDEDDDSSPLDEWKAVRSWWNRKL